MLFWDVIGIIGFLTNVVGNALLAWWKHPWGWPIRLVPNVCWAAFAISAWHQAGMLALLANSLTFFVINLVGWWRWTRKQNLV